MVTVNAIYEKKARKKKWDVKAKQSYRRCYEMGL